MTELLKDLEAVVAKLTDAEGWECTGDQMRCMDGNGCECAMQGRDRPDTDGTAVNFIRTHHAEIAEAVKDARRWRHARKILPVEYIEGSQREFESYGLPGSEEENIAADNAIDAAMHNSAREDGE